MESPIEWWLGDLYAQFDRNREVLKGLDTVAEQRLEKKLESYFSRVIESGHGLDHHMRVEAFASVIGLVENINREELQLCRYAAMVHDVSKVLSKGGREHNWDKTRKLSMHLMKESGIEGTLIPRILSIVEEHDEDDPYKRSRLGNVVYDADTNDLTNLPRCLTFAGAIERFNPGTYNTIGKISMDYKKYHVKSSNPTTSSGRRMFERGKEWSLPTLDGLENTLGDSNMRPYFPFLDFRWKENMSGAPEILRETLSSYREFVPRYDINLK